MSTMTDYGRPASAGEARSATRSWGWLLGPLIGVSAIAVMMVTGAGFSVGDDLPVAEMLTKLEEARSVLLLGGASEALAAMGLVIFGVWAADRLRAVEPEGALTSRVVSGGAFVTAAMLAVAAAHTQLATVDAADAVDPAVPLTLHTLEENLFAGAWCSLALMSGAVAVAAFRHRVVPTWLGGVSAFVTALLLIAQVVVPWAGWFPSAIWLIVAGVGLRKLPSGRAGASH